jgi:hypothetical protein
MCKGCTEYDEFGKFADMDAQELAQARASVAAVLRVNNWDKGLTNSDVLLVASSYLEFLKGYDTCSGEFSAYEFVREELWQHGGDMSSYVALLVSA